MPYTIHKRGSKYCVVKESDNSVVACHPTRRQAERQLAALYASEQKSITFKEDGQRYMLLVSSNAYEDRADEIVRENALREYVANFEPNPHLFWHGGEPIGEIIAAQMAGPFLLEISRELPDQLIDLAREADDPPMLVSRKAVWDALEAEHIPWGASIGFYGRQSDKRKRLFGMIQKKETSSLPLVKAANSLTPSFVIGGKSMSEAVKKERRNLWKELFGGKTSSELEAAMEGVRAVLDKSGVQRKELDTKVVKGLLEDMQARIMELLGELTDDETIKQNLANTIAAELMGTATEVVDETMPEAPPMEEMQNPEDEQPMPEQFMELAEQVKSLASESADVQNEMKEFIPAFIEMATVVKNLAPLVEKAQAFDDLSQRVAAMEKLVALSPRPASKAGLTVESDKIKKEIEKSLDGKTKTVLGWEVRE